MFGLAGQDPTTLLGGKGIGVRAKTRPWRVVEGARGVDPGEASRTHSAKNAKPRTARALRLCEGKGIVKAKCGVCRSLARFELSYADRFVRVCWI